MSEPIIRLPLEIFDKGLWVCKETDQEFNGAQLDAEAFTKYRLAVEQATAEARAEVEAVERISQASLENIADKWQMAEGKCDDFRAEVEKLRAEKLRADYATLLENASVEVRRLRAEALKLEDERDEARAEIERLRVAAQGVLEAMEVVRTAKQSEGAGGGNWISRPATREHQARMQKAYADMHKAETDLMGVVK